MDELWLLLMALPLFVVVGACFGIRAWVVTRHLRDHITQLQERVQELEQREAPRTTDVATARPPENLTAPPPRPEAEPAPPPTRQESATPTEATQHAAADAAWGVEPAPAAEQPPTISISPPITAEAPRFFDRLAANLRANWMIWLGGICVGLAGVFMVHYSIEQGLLGPEARVILSLIAGVVLHGAAEWLRRSRGQHDVFAALAGGASIILYAALFAAFKLLNDISPGLIFTGMALVSFATQALALRHGPVLAALGMLGGYLVPILVNTGSGQIELALIYIGILTLFSLWLLAYVERRWLWLGVIAGSLGWWLLSLGSHPADGVRSLYLLALTYLFLAVPGYDWLLQRRDEPASHWLQLLKQVRSTRYWPVLPTLVLIVLAQGITLATETVSRSSYPTLLLLPALLLLAASRRPILNPLPVLLLLATALAVVMPMLSYLGDQLLFTAPDAATQAALVSRFVMLTILYTAGSAWLLQRRVEYPGFWVGLGCFTPLLMLALGYYLFTAFTADWAWGGAALILGLIYLTLSKMALERPTSDLVRVLLISSAHLGLSLAAVIWLVDATLTLAFAVQLITLSLLQRHYQLRLLPWVIRLLLAVVICRLTFNPWLLTYDSGTHWSLWTYGGSTLCAFAGAWILRHDHKLTAWLQGAAAHLLVLTLAAEVRYWLYDGDIFRHEYSFLEASLNTLIWGSAGCVYLWRARLSQYLQRFYQVIATLHLLAAAGNHLLLVVLWYNPLWHSTEISPTPLWNLLLISYGLPSLLMLILWRLLPGRIGRYSAMAAGLNWLLFISLEIRHLWQGKLSLSYPTPDGELYTYSAVWLLMASGALLGGNWLQKASLYRGGLALLLVVVAKLFLIDMSDLTGLWRVASFMGLGLALLALAWLHQRLTPKSSVPPDASGVDAD
ncbi:DUF2339 domain-containing protein [Marinobacterium sediminicola]|uniref:Uncharacterized membrane protein n=1 Tax=Marinobacterium sediminicola TaxID=518898 RepID=A0ABY1S144_9GAMM|nr:DUF2339 domain-containing protein [Marinobacterium sediminicola]ULG69813.1 DUF2339 domain-containing protein [Marinobacterium sediminicola]SMR75373.1 Uncharacterized membrane protein [Marinobacterium sediminicola]